jgi:hypothetical protein
LSNTWRQQNDVKNKKKSKAKTEVAEGVGGEKKVEERKRERRKWVYQPLVFDTRFQMGPEIMNLPNALESGFVFVSITENIDTVGLREHLHRKLCT